MEVKLFTGEDYNAQGKYRNEIGHFPKLLMWSIGSADFFIQILKIAGQKNLLTHAGELIYRDIFWYAAFSF